MKNVVLDSYAIITFLEQEKGHEIVSSIFDECIAHDQRAAICVVNWGEVYYMVLREAGEKGATLALDTMRALPLEIVDVNQELTLQAGKFKAHHKMSYAEAFAAALAKARKAELVTGDKEIKTVEHSIRVRWI